MSRSTLSVILPNYNHAKYLEQSLGSILSQSRRPDRVLVIDDQSTDNSLEVISRFTNDPIVELIRNPKNLGSVVTVNSGLDRVDSDYVIVLAADDSLLPGFIEKTMSLLERHPEAALGCSHPAYMDEHGKLDLHEDWPKYSTEPVYIPPGEAVGALGPKSLWIAGHTCIFKREVLNQVGRFLPELRWHSDWFACHVMAFRHGICYQPEPLAAFRTLSTSYSASAMDDIPARSQVFFAMAELLKSERFADVKDAFLKSKAFDLYPEFKDGVFAELEPWRRVMASRSHELEVRTRTRQLEENKIFTTHLESEISKTQIALQRETEKRLELQKSLEELRAETKWLRDLKAILLTFRPLWGRVKRLLLR